MSNVIVICSIKFVRNAAKDLLMKIIIGKYLIIIYALLSIINNGFTQEYKIGQEDVLSITFWQQPELNTSVRVSQNGDIVLPVIGSITAAGLTPTELAKKIVGRISLFNKNISQASVVVTQYGSKKVYVTGHVLQPGKYAFEIMPDLWKIILEAGGPAETATLNRVQVIRGKSNAGKILTVDLNDAINSGDFSSLPLIYPGDTINIPGLTTETTSSELGTPGGVTSTQVDEDVIYIYGQVARPGGHKFSKKMTLLEAIVIAGGPTATAKLDEVKVIMKGDHYSTVATINLNRYAKEGTPTPFMLKPGDTIFIPQEKQPFWRVFQQGILYDMMRMVVTAGTSILIYSLVR